MDLRRPNSGLSRKAKLLLQALFCHKLTVLSSAHTGGVGRTLVYKRTDFIRLAKLKLLYKIRADTLKVSALKSVQHEGTRTPRPESLDPKSNAATNYATCAVCECKVTLFCIAPNFFYTIV